VWIEYAALLAVGLGLASTLSPFFLTVAVAFALMGVVYNVEPIRSKDRVFIDVLSESFNNPLRLLLGWFIVTDWPLPPASLMLGYWMAGAFLMAVKRFAELRFLGSREIAEQYRRSFHYYTEESLIISALFYACCSSFFLGVFLVKYRVELILTLPFLAVAFAWYLHIGLRADSPAQRPEHLYREHAFAAYLAFLGVLLTVAFVIDVSPLHWFLIRVLEVGNEIGP
jgi:4-hydroxybenzoate polyprenyltransferase